MLIFEYQCRNCSSIFESAHGHLENKCLACGSLDIARVNSMVFSPDRNFCPKEKQVERVGIKRRLIELLGDRETKCYYKCK